MKISIITTSYNYADFIPETIESVLKQTYSDFEYIIFDDGSTDNSLEIINSYALKDNRIKVLTHQNNENKGIIYTMKQALNIAQGDYIIFVESDDTISPDYIEQKLKVVQKYPDAAVIFNLIRPVGDSKRVQKCHKYITKATNLINKPYFDYYELFTLNIIPTFSCVMAKKEVLEKIPFEFEVPKCFDWYLWNYIIQNYNIVFLDKPLTNFRLHNISMSCTRPKDQAIYNALLKLSKRKYNYNIFYKIFTFYKNFTRLEKLLRPICAKIDKAIYKSLYVHKDVSVIKAAVD